MADEPVAEPIEAEIRRRYGFMAWALDIPQVGDLLRQAATEDWDEARFRGALYATDWWKEKSQGVREFERLRAEDPASMWSQMFQKGQELRLAASRMGITLDDQTDFAMAEDAIKFGWDEQTIQAALGNHLAFEPDGKPKVGAEGTIAAFVTRMNQLESDYLVHISQDTKNDFTRRFAQGAIDQTAVENYFLTQAKSRRPYLAEQLDMGITTRNYFAPYIEQTAKLLEISPGEIDLLDNPRYAQMTEMAGADGKIRPMTLYEAGRYIRGLDDYKQTHQAQDLGATYSDAILRTFGEVA